MGQLSKKDAQIGQMDGMVRSVEDEMRRIRGEVKQRQESEEQMRSVSFYVQKCTYVTLSEFKCNFFPRLPKKAMHLSIHSDALGRLAGLLFVFVFILAPEH